MKIKRAKLILVKVLGTTLKYVYTIYNMAIEYIPVRVPTISEKNPKSN